MHVIATAGHVDHGKSALVRALTGTDPDRLAEEQRRGMTIDLGFAGTTLPSGEQVAFVDVPGHARFVPTMLAGVGPVPAVLFVVAADEGWREQSAEHLDALTALGVRHGLLAVTRADLADPGPATAAAREALAGGPLADLPAVPVSARTGAGLDRLRDALDALVAGLPRPDPAAPVRLWVDRVFTVRGAGTVVTGTLGAGSIAVGDRLAVGGTTDGGPGGDRPTDTVVVRGLQTLNRPQQRVGPVARVAVNLRGVDRLSLARGCALLTPGRWLQPAVVDVGCPTDGLPAELTAHVGSAAVPVRVRPLGSQSARLSLATRLPLRLGDRLLLRDPGRHDLLVAGTVLALDPPALRRRGAAARRAADLAARAAPDPAAELIRLGYARPDRLAAAGLDPAAAGGRPVGGWLVAEPTLQAWAERLLAGLAGADPLDPGLRRETARQLLDVPDPALVDAAVAAAGGRIVLGGGRLLRPGERPSLPGPAAAAVDRLRARLAADPFAAPDADELRAAGLTDRLQAAAVRAGLLARVGDVLLAPDWAERAVERLTALGGDFTTSDARRALGTSRRVAIPVLEALDARGATRRLDAAHRRLAG